MPETTIEPTADWTCERCQVTVSWMADVERPELPGTWIREGDGDAEDPDGGGAERDEELVAVAGEPDRQSDRNHRAPRQAHRGWVSAKRRAQGRHPSADQVINSIRLPRYPAWGVPTLGW